MDTTEKFVIVTTQHRGVFAGFVTPDAIEASNTTKRIEMRQAKMAIRFGCERGIAQLAHTGPTSNSRIGDPADVLLHNITAIFGVTEAAQKAWAAR